MVGHSVTLSLKNAIWPTGFQDFDDAGEINSLKVTVFHLQWPEEPSNPINLPAGMGFRALP